ncbi:hypothetical protein [Globicatella sanguinis]|uniref:hypothetical protein n=1 Tax=Globicatella sanguinis TaxID=13076 RepID=UPI000826DFFC|nr:hypothetical protein [Globicatella sanguinis]
MKKHIKTVALVTTGLVVGVVVARLENKKKDVSLDDLKISTEKAVEALMQVSQKLDRARFKMD